MLIEIQKTETREVVLNETRYVCFADRGYYRFTPVKDNIEVLMYRDREDEFELSCRIGLWESQIAILELTHVYAVKITEDEFNTKLQDLLLHYI
jgi:hypothetical protein